MRIRTSLLAASLASGIGAPCLSAAQHPPAPGQSPMSAESVQCAQAQPVIAGTVDGAMARLEAARQANTPSQMRAAIDDLQGALRDVRAQLAPCASMQPPAGAHGGHAMPMAPASPGATPSDPPMDHSKMPMGAAPAARPATGGQSAPMDHSTMEMKAAPAAKPDKGAKPEAPAAPMDPSKMSRGKPADSAGQATDPVCGLKVDPATAPKAAHQGQTYSFCSEQHRQLFQKNPAKFLPKGR